jgi:hypothetical protein
MSNPYCIPLELISRTIQRLESSIGGLRPDDDPMKMCLSTPAFIYGQNYNGPVGCQYWVCIITIALLCIPLTEPSVIAGLFELLEHP